MKSPTLLLLAIASLALAGQIPLRNPHLQQISSSSPDHAPSYRDALLSLHKSLVTIPSTSHNETHLGHQLTNLLTSLNYTTSTIPVPSSSAIPRFNILAWPRSVKQPTGRILLTTHFDTVPPYIPYSVTPSTPSTPITTSTRILGRGTVDAKGSLAAQVTALNLLLHSGLNPTAVTLLFVVGEEVNGDGMEAFTTAVLTGSSGLSGPVKAAIFGEPTEGKLACGHKGGLYCTMHATGKAAHSGYPWLGHSATEVLVKALYRVATEDLGSSEKYGNSTVNIGTLSGGVASNVVPAAASASLGVRVAIGPAETGGEIVKGRILKIMAETDPGLTLDCPQKGYGYVESDCDVPGFATAIENYGTDMPHLKVGQTNYLYGPGSIFVAHGDDEGITVGELEAAVEGYQKLVKFVVDKYKD